MEITIVGATGSTGGRLVAAALTQGHTVRALARDPGKVTSTDPRLTVVAGDVRDPAAVAQAVRGSDAVLSALGPSADDTAHAILATGTANLIAQMEALGPRRLLVISAAPVAPLDGGEPFIYRYVARPLLSRVFRDLYADMRAMEDAVRASSLDWTIVRPPRLVDGDADASRPATLAIGGTVGGGYSLARGALAAAMLSLVADPRASRAGVGVGA